MRFVARLTYISFLAWGGVTLAARFERPLAGLVIGGVWALGITLLVFVEYLAARREQARLHRAVARCIGTIRGDDPGRCENVRAIVQRELARKYPRPADGA